MLASMGCSSELTSIPVNNFDANQDGNFSAGIGANGNGNWPRDENCGKGLAMPTRDNLATLCSCYYFKETAAACRSLCMCGTSGGGGGGCQEPPENTAPCDPTPCASPWICVNQNCQCP